MFLEFLVENKAFYLSKRALQMGTAHKKWFKKALQNVTEKMKYGLLKLVVILLTFQNICVKNILIFMPNDFTSRKVF